MSIYRVNVDHVALLQSGQSQAPGHDTGREGSHGSSGPDASHGDEVQLTGKVGAAYDELQRKNERQNGIAAGIRTTDRSAELLGQKIDSLKAPLQTIVKNYPPFSPNDQARMKLLMSYSAIRREIDQLILPPPPDVIEARKALELPPALPSTADHSQIADHVDKLDAAQASLKALRDALAADTAFFLQQIGPAGPSSASDAAENAPSGAPLNGFTASRLASEVGRQFATSVRQGVTVQVHSQFLKELS